MKIPIGKDPAFVVCFRNEGFEASLSVRKLYRSLPDDEANSHDLVRVIDDTGEDYLYPVDFFSPVEVSEEAAATLV